ncbi:MFS transporter [Dactylosporangium vinaceum]|uniref:MFS transporter n=1 Tax=Dactylosporangium vinaceum TaxID=53362 RepID=A0ABV5MD86_9ACTN|nr:MFS transporter [Dactylosporangium vinaceum]
MHNSEVLAARSLRQVWPAIAGLAAVFLFEMLDNSILSVALPTIGADLHASTTALQWVTGSYAVVFGGFMLVFGAVADRYGRRRIMLAGLVLLGVASAATAAVTTAEQLIAVRVVMGVAAAMTTPGAMSLAFRLFDDDGLRVRALNIITTVGVVGLAAGPTAGGLVLRVAPWPVLLLINVPIAALAFAGIKRGIAADAPQELHRDPIDVSGAVLGTAAVLLLLTAPTRFVEDGARSAAGWVAAVAGVIAVALFVVRQRRAAHPLLDPGLIARPLVAGGLAYKAAQGLGTASLTYLVSLQLQLDWGWSPARAAIGMLPQVVVLLAGGAVVSPFVKRAGLGAAAWISSASVVTGLAVYAALGTYGYLWVAVALVLVAFGTRMVGVVAVTNVMRGLPAERTTVGAALIDTASQITTGIGIAGVGTVLAARFTGSIAAGHWSAAQTEQFENAVRIGGFGVTALAAALSLWAFLRARGAGPAADGSR